MNIREANTEDVSVISEIATECSLAHIAPGLSHNGAQQLIREMTSVKQAERLKQGYVFFLAAIDELVVGIAGSRPPSHLYYLFVRTEYQRQGIGKQLFDVVRNHVAATSDAREITVNSSLNAVDAYRKLGFVETGPVETRNDVHFQPMLLNLE